MATMSDYNDPFGDSSIDIDQLSDELTIQQGVLASLLDLPETPDRNRHIAAVKNDIAKIKRRLNEARSKGAMSAGCHVK